MKVVLVGPFERANERGMFSDIAAGRRVDDGQPTGLVYDRHTSTLMALAVPSDSEVLDAGGMPVSLWFGSGDFGFTALSVEVDDRASLHALEPQLERIVNVALAARFGESRTQKSGYVSHRVLWWHRVLIDVDADLPRAVRHFGQRVAVDVDAECVVGNGFSVLKNADRTARAEFLAGLMAATEDWMIIDSLSRRLRNALLAARDAADAQLEGAVRDAEQAAYLTTLALLLMDERRRNLANLVQGVHGAAARSWGLQDDLTALREHSAAVGSLVTGFYEQRSDRADERRNTILFGFTVVTVLQSLLMIVEFGAGSRIELLSVVRLLLSGLVLAGTLLIILRYLRSGREPASDQLS
jgi:hypothetical protein